MASRQTVSAEALRLYRHLNPWINVLKAVTCSRAVVAGSVLAAQAAAQATGAVAA
jgi:hypothetical protein